MTTITIDDPKIKEAYSSYEIRMKFLQFLQQELQEDSVELYQISIDDLPSDVRKAYEKIDELEFVEA